MFGLKFINEGIVDKKWAKLFTTLFDRRHESDYKDFFFMSEDEVQQLYIEVAEFRTVIKNYLESV